MNIPLDALELTESEKIQLIKWSSIFFENGLRLMHLSNFINVSPLDKETITMFLQEKIREGMDHLEKEVSIESGIKLISDDTNRLILSMLEMIKLEADNDSYTEA